MSIGISGNTCIMKVKPQTLATVILTKRMATSISETTFRNKHIENILLINDKCNIEYIFIVKKYNTVSIDEIRKIFKNDTHEAWQTLIEAMQIYQLDKPININEIEEKKKFTTTISYLSNMQCIRINEKIAKCSLKTI